jgi:hypothetical protein
LAGLLGWSLVLFQTEGEYSYRRWTSLIVPTMLILNHLAFNIVHKKPWSILLKIAAGVFLAFGCFILFSGRWSRVIRVPNIRVKLAGKTLSAIVARRRIGSFALLCL